MVYLESRVSVCTFFVYPSSTSPAASITEFSSHPVEASAEVQFQVGFIPDLRFKFGDSRMKSGTTLCVCGWCLPVLVRSGFCSWMVGLAIP